MKLFVAVFASLLLALVPAIAQHGSGEPDGHNTHSYNHHLGVFVGAASNLEYEYTDLAVGVDWEFFLHGTSPSLGIGLMAEVVLADHMEYIAAVPVFVHPWAGLKFWVAPGAIYAHPHEVHTDDTGHKFFRRDRPQVGDEGTSEAWTNFLLRVGVGYDFHVDEYSIAPTVSADIFKSQVAIVWGVTFGVAL
ncbi:MAG: hypothetical protein ACLFQX_08510 [Candidatus Kapaibacterium sp.]